MSLGNLKKVGIVLSLMHKPELLILDEPTSGLDPIMQKTFHNILLEEKEKGTTILYSSHVLSEVSSICDKIGFIKDGVIIKEDLMENIKKNNYTYLTVYTKDIEKLKTYDLLDVLDQKLKEVVEYREKYPESSLQELSEIMSEKLGYTITKSGLNHRFRKIKDMVSHLDDKKVYDENT